MNLQLSIGEVLRYRRDKDPKPQLVDGVLNFFHVTHCPGMPRLILERGIFSPATTKAPDGDRQAAILIRSSPHRVGSATTPWQDFFNVDRGHIRYFGDNKHPGRGAEGAQGNRLLSQQYHLYGSVNSADRLKAAPLLFFRGVSRGGRQKGFLEFQGFGLIEAIQLVTQIDPKTKKAFVNLAFDFLVFDQSHEAETFDWRWINARRDSTQSAKQCLALAPAAWKQWAENRGRPLETFRRRVSKLQVVPRAEQSPPSGSKEESALQTIYSFYSRPGMKKRFEALAQVIASRVIGDDRRGYRIGWITPGGGDGGADFIDRLDIGKGFASTKLIVLGQAKCEQLDAPTGGNHIARTVSRLKRGWVGVYVTTSYFSRAVQEEMIEDAYPIVPIHGLRVASEVLIAVREGGFYSVEAYLKSIDDMYDSLIRSRVPEEILLEP